MREQAMTFRLFTLLLAALLLAACSEEPTRIGAHLPSPPAATLGPQFTVLKAPRDSYIINSVPDVTGRVHLIVALEDAKEVRHVVIGAQGVESSEVIRNRDESRTVDIAFDRAGKLHALIGDEHLVKQGGKWVGGQPTPWREANLAAGQFRHSLEGGMPGFVKGMPDLTWAFYMTSDYDNWPTRTDWVSSGVGWGSLLVHPKSQKVWKPVVVPEETPYREWNVLGMEDNLDAAVAGMAGSRGTVFYAVYQGSRYTSSYQYEAGELRYAAFNMAITCRTDDADVAQDPMDTDDAGEPGSRPRKSRYSFCGVGGGPFPVSNPPQSVKWNLYIPRSSVAIDPESGAVLVAGDEVSNLWDPASGRETVADLPIKNVTMLLASAGNNRFQALALDAGMKEAVHPAYYMELSHGAWSAPVEVGKYWSSIHSRIDEALNVAVGPSLDRDLAIGVIKLINAGKDRTLIVWPREDALVGRWVTLK